jgi:hypothetical protein
VEEDEEEEEEEDQEEDQEEDLLNPVNLILQGGYELQPALHCCILVVNHHPSCRTVNSTGRKLGHP